MADADEGRARARADRVAESLAALGPDVDSVDALTAVVPADVLAGISGEVSIDLKAAQINHAGGMINFDIDPIRQTKLIKGWDDIDLTTQHVDEIVAFKKRYHANNPWAIPTN